MKDAGTTRHTQGHLRVSDSDEPGKNRTTILVLGDSFLMSGDSPPEKCHGLRSLVAISRTGGEENENSDAPPTNGK